MEKSKTETAIEAALATDESANGKPLTADEKMAFVRGFIAACDYSVTQLKEMLGKGYL